jgi:two-component system response regulator YesN
VLVVDDDATARAALATLLDEEGLVVETATGGQDALAKLVEFPAEVALVDVQMPGMTGIELVERARATHPDLQCVLMTGFDERSASLRGSTLPQVCKPVDFDRLLQLIASLVSDLGHPRWRRGG